MRTFSSLATLIDDVPTPVFLVDEAGTLRHANSAGHEALRQSHPLVVKNGFVRPANARLSKQFEQQLSAAAADHKKHPKQKCMIRLLGNNGKSTALALHHVSSLSGPAVVVMLFLTTENSATGRSATDEIRLQVIFGLTPSEARLAGYLIRGKSLSQISGSLLLSRETLKSQLGSLFKKTRTHRQGELVAVLLSSISFSSV